MLPRGAESSPPLGLGLDPQQEIHDVADADVVNMQPLPIAPAEVIADSLLQGRSMTYPSACASLRQYHFSLSTTLSSGSLWENRRQFSSSSASHFWR